MTVYIDKANIRFRRMIMCHMIADTPEELHAMAYSIGMKREWFQENASFPHYDVSKSRKEKALKLGAVEVDKYQLVKQMRQIRENMKNAGN